MNDRQVSSSGLTGTDMWYFGNICVDAPDELDLEMLLVKYVCFYHFHLTGIFPNVPV